MSTRPSSLPAARSRRSAEQVRDEALAAARACLMEAGPNAITLQEIGRRIGMTHANLIHHFGSAAGLQTALMGAMLRDLNDALDAAVTHILSEHPAAQREMIDLVFDAFDRGGAAKLAAWIALSGNVQLLGPLRNAILALVDDIDAKLPPDAEISIGRVKSTILFIALNAFADAMIGGFLRDTLDRDEDAARKIVARLLPTFY